MKILVTGANGQLGREILTIMGRTNQSIVGIDFDDVDFSKPSTVAQGIAQVNADWVINCAAFTQVDRAEHEQSLAHRVNCESAREVAVGAARSHARLLHISTDFIFDGRRSSPYDEEVAPKPICVYGETKWAGEQEIKNILPDALIIRTAWVYGIHGNNFVRTMLKLAAERDEIKVVDDQIGTPSWTGDIVSCIASLIEYDAAGIYNFTNEGTASWFDFAVSIVEIGKQLQLPLRATVRPISTSNYSTAARRPSYSVLSKEKVRSRLTYPIPHWRAALRAMLTALNDSDLKAL